MENETNPTTTQNTLPKVTFMTGNPNKLKEFKAITDGILDVTNFKLDLPEYQGSPQEVAKEKCKLAFKELNKPVITEDTSLCFNALNGLPGVYIKWFLKGLGIEGLPKLIAGFEDKTGYAQCIFAYMDSTLEEPLTFVGQCPGTIVQPQGDNAFGWDPIFQPEGFTKTFAQIDKTVKNTISHRKKASDKLIEFFKNKAN